MTKSRLSMFAALAGLVLVVSACSPSAPAAEHNAEPSLTPAAIPATPVGMMTQWILDEMNDDEATSSQEWDGVLHDEFTAEVSAVDVADLINTQIRPARPLVATEYSGTERESVTTVVGEVGEPFEMTVVIDADDSITGFLLAPLSPPREPAQSLPEAEDRWAAIDASVNVLVSLDEETLVSLDASAPAPLGSIFKLYVLAAVADAVEAGTLSWDETLTVTDESRSLPSGELQDVPTGTEVSVRSAAEKMIAISDNTATDLLIDRLGRDAIQTAVASLGHSDPSLMSPFLSTQQFFTLLWGPDENLAHRWSEGTDFERYTIVEELEQAEFHVTSADATDQPRWQDDIEWFASAADISRAHSGLNNRAQHEQTVDDILTANPGISVNEDEWPHVAFKGGSSPGVLTGSWFAKRSDGAELSVVVLSSRAESSLDAKSQAELFGLVQDVFDVLGAD